MMYDILIQRMRDEVTKIGAKELRTPEEVDAVLPTAKGTTLVVVNSNFLVQFYLMERSPFLQVYLK